MGRLLFVLPSVGAGDAVRLDTDSDTDTPADIVPAGGGPVITGAVLHAGVNGALPRVLGPADGTDTLYLKELDYRGTATGDPVTLTGVDLDAAPDAPTGGSSPLRVVTADTTASAQDEIAVVSFPLAGAATLTARASVSTSGGAPATISHTAHTDDPLQLKRAGFQLIAGLMDPSGYTGATFADGAGDVKTTHDDPGATGSVLDYSYLNDPWGSEDIGASIAAGATASVYVCVDVVAAEGAAFPNPNTPSVSITAHTHAPIYSLIDAEGTGRTVVLAVVTLGSTPPTLTATAGQTWTLLLQQAIGSGGFITLWEAFVTESIPDGTDVIVSEQIDAGFLLSVSSRSAVTVTLPPAEDGNDVTVLNGSTTAADPGIILVVPDGTDPIKGKGALLDTIDTFDSSYPPRRYRAISGAWYPQSLTH